MQLFRRGLVLHVAYGQTVAEPLPAQLGKERAFAHALRAVEHHHAVKFDSRPVHPRHRRHHHLPRNRAGIGRIRRAQIVHEQRVHARHTVPRGQGLDVVADGMVTPLRCDGQQDTLELGRGVQAVDMLQINLQRAQIRFVPARLDGRPRDGAAALGVPADVDAAAVDVVGDVPEPGVVAQDQRQIAQRVFDAALLVHLQLFLPVFVLRRLCFLSIQIAKLLRGLLPAFLTERAARGLVLRGVLLHPADGILPVAHMRAVRGRAARREQMHTHKVKRIAQLPARRVGGVVRIGVLVVIDHQPACGAAAHEGVAVVLRRGCVSVREGVFEDVRNAVRPAERPDDPTLGQRVFLPGDRAAHLRLHRLGRRPERGVRPVGIGGQHLVRSEERLVRAAEQVLAVLGRAGPVHQPCRLKGRGVEAGKRQFVRDAAGDGRVLVRRDGTG